MTPQEALAQAIDAHRQQVRREWQQAHRDDPEYGDIIHLCDDDCSAAILDALPEGAYLVVPPPHQRLILASEDLLTAWGTRTAEGFAITAEWSEQEPEGWYEPRFTIHSDDDLAAKQREAGAQQERERLRAVFSLLGLSRSPERWTWQVWKQYIDSLLADPEDDR